MIVPDFTLTTSARLDHDSYFGYHVTPKLYGNWTLDETWALKGASLRVKKPPTGRPRCWKGGAIISAAAWSSECEAGVEWPLRNDGRQPCQGRKSTTALLNV